MKAVFFDRDGTLIKEVNYLTKVEQIKIYEDVLPLLYKLKNNGFLNIIITNQSAVARGLLKVEELEYIHEYISGLFYFNNVKLIDDIFYSPYHTKGTVEEFSIESDDRKPGTGLIRKAKEKFSLDLSQCYYIGDSYSDMKCAENAGIKRILVKTGYGLRDYKKITGECISLDFYANDVYEAIEYILK